MIRKILFLIFVLSASVSVFAEIKILTEQSWQVVYDASDYLEQENYEMIKQKLYNSSNTYYEGQAVNLAIAYYALAEYDAALEICKALIKYNGENLLSTERNEAISNVITVLSLVAVKRVIL